MNYCAAVRSVRPVQNRTGPKVERATFPQLGPAAISLGPGPVGSVNFGPQAGRKARSPRPALIPMMSLLKRALGLLEQAS